jgi:small multidrug resistance pump
MLHWLLLYLAIALEVAGTTTMKLSRGFSELVPSLLTFVLYVGSLASLMVAMNRLQMGIAYAIWSGLGTTAAAIIGIVCFHEPVSALKIACLGIVVLGVAGLNLSGAGH